MKFSTEELGKLQKLSSLYLRTKALILYSEEIDPNSSSNLQVIKELRDAFDHLMQFIIYKDETVQSGVQNESNFGIVNIEKAVGHVYRAAFDALDGSVVSLKEMIIDSLNKYPLDVITVVLDDYWEIKRDILRISERVGKLRGNKDVSEKSTVILNDYVREVETLKEIYEKILTSGPSFDEFLKDQKINKFKTYTIRFGISFIIAAIFFVLGLLFGS